MTTHTFRASFPKHLANPAHATTRPHHQWRWPLAGLGLAAVLTLCPQSPALAAEPQAPELPGQGVTVQAVKSSLPEELFQTTIVNRALAQLGYTVLPVQETEYITAFVALANGDVDYMPVYWSPLQDGYYEKMGGDETLWRSKPLVNNNVMGYLIDKRTADAHGIRTLDQLKDPEIAKLFDADGDGKADLIGCNAGWVCEQVINHHIQAYDLQDTVSNTQGSYAALIADTVTRQRSGQPVLFYAWTPHWISSVLPPGQATQWLQVPFSAQPDDDSRTSTQLADGSDYGFPVSTQHIAANRVFAEANPAAAKLFDAMEIPVADISAQNSRMHEGENTVADVERHADAWIAMHRVTFDGWLQEARNAADSAASGAASSK